MSYYPWLKEKKAYWFWLKSAGRAIAALCHLKTEGRENIPDEGGVLIVSNHRSFLDPPLVAYAVYKRPVFFMAKEELFEVPILSSLIKHWGNGFPVKRGGSDTKALKTSISLLSAGKVLCVFPEGTRAPKGKFLKAKPGAAMLAMKAKVPIVPCLIEGSEDVLPRGSKLPRPGNVLIRFGEPFFIKQTKLDRQSVREVSEILMQKIRELRD